MSLSGLTQTPRTTGRVPSRAEAEALAHDLLAHEGTRLAHVRTAGFVADRLGVLFDEADAALLVAAATLHDIGYSARIARTGFHPLDGGLHLLGLGYSPRLAGLVAHHSHAHLLAIRHDVDLDSHFAREESLLVDALVYADMHSAPDGRIIHAEARLADIASRRGDDIEPTRARHLRTAMARVGSALLAAQVAGTHREQAGPARTRRAFEEWWRAEARYSLEVTSYAHAPERDDERRDSALRLAELRGSADVHRDRYFRAALG